MTLHVACAGWLLGEPSGANRRLLAVLTHAGTQLTDRERITVLHRPDFEPPQLARIAWQPIAIPAAPTWRRLLAEQRLLPTCLRQLGANVYEHGFLPLPRLPVPSCLTVHDLRAADGLTTWPRWLAQHVLRRSCARAAAVVVPSQWTAERLRRFVPSAPSPVVVANGVEAPSNASPSAQLSVPAHGFVLHVGHVEARKNLEVVVRALALVPAAERPELWLVGRDAGGLAKLLALAERLSCRTSVRVLGAVPDDELRRLYPAARAVLMPSTYEGFGLPVLEALAHGRPVLASREAALPEVLGEAGCLLPAHDAKAWSSAIVETARDLAGGPAMRRARAAKWPWQRAVEAQLRVWRAVLMDHG